ncbi:hypothetical protein OUZ56_017124 [Daphnia magna]|uniref:C2H2-type domain-containing protein n=1 Tax=Daphnia magna TaxID=35525 RepID=A0ABR0ASA1_9CRUS|nr:hypothetical protein OUZ56_017124 [Daphnia magna]
MGSIHRHLETAHTLRLVKYWECGVCGFAGDGPTLKGHYQRLHSAPQQSPSIRSPRFFNADTSVRHSSVVATFQEEIAVTEDERQELSVMGMPAIEEEGHGNAQSPANFTQSPILLALRTPSTRNFLSTTCSSGRATTRSPSRDPTLFPSQQNVRGCSQESSEEQSQRGGDFACLWVPAFLSCETLLDLEGVLERCTADWLNKAQILEDPSPEKPRGNPNGRKKETKTGRCREPGDRSSSRHTKRGRFNGFSISTQEEPFERCSEIVHPRTMALLKLRRNTSRGLTTARVYLRSSARVRGYSTTPATGPIHQGTRWTSQSCA